MFHKDDVCCQKKSNKSELMKTGWSDQIKWSEFRFENEVLEFARYQPAIEKCRLFYARWRGGGGVTSIGG